MIQSLLSLYCIKKELMKKYIAYYRVSTKRQNLGLEAQKNTVMNYINSNCAELISAYEEKESGKDNTRSELHKAIAECKRINATLIIAKLDRLSRNVSFIFTLKDSGIPFYCCDLPECNTLTLGIFATIAQNERETISMRTKLALEAKKNQGYKLGCPNASISNEMRIKSAEALKRKADNNTNNKHAYVVISSLLDKGLSLRKIANYLNENEFKTSNGCLFTATSVSRLIKRFKQNNL